MMSLDEAILHAEEVADRCEDFVVNHKNLGELGFTKRTEKCAAEHKQLATWLRELRKRRKEPEVIRCNECAFCRPFLSDKVCSLGLLHNINTDMDFCSRAVRKPGRRTDGEKQSD